MGNIGADGEIKYNPNTTTSTSLNPSFEEWAKYYTDNIQKRYNSAINYANEYKNIAYQNAANAYDYAAKEANLNKERAVIDANNSYAKNLATYGTNAEALGRMGVNSGGYGEYIQSRAYAQNRADKQAAYGSYSEGMRLAADAKNQAELNATLAYNDLKYKAEEDKNSAELDLKDREITYKEGKYSETLKSIIDIINSGTDLNEWLKEDNNKALFESLENIDKQQIIALDTSVKNTAQENKRLETDTFYSDAVNWIISGASIDTIKKLSTYNELSEEQKASLETEYNNYIVKVADESYRALSSDITNGLVTDWSVIDTYNISDEKKVSLYGLWAETMSQFSYLDDNVLAQIDAIAAKYPAFAEKQKKIYSDYVKTCLEAAETEEDRNKIIEFVKANKDKFTDKDYKTFVGNSKHIEGINYGGSTIRKTSTAQIIGAGEMDLYGNMFVNDYNNAAYTHTKITDESLLQTLNGCTTKAGSLVLYNGVVYLLTKGARDTSYWVKVSHPNKSTAEIVSAIKGG